VAAATGHYLNQEQKPGAPIETVVPQSTGMALFLSSGDFPHTALYDIALFGPRWPDDPSNVWCADRSAQIDLNGSSNFTWEAFHTCPGAPDSGRPYAREPIVAAGIVFRACSVGIDRGCTGDAVIDWDASPVWEWWIQPDGRPSPQ
jgi:hypothetical protein